MYVHLLQPKLAPCEIARNAQAVIALLSDENKKTSATSLYLCGCETTLGQTCETLQHPDAALIEQRYALQKIQHHLRTSTLLIGGVAAKAGTTQGAQHQLFFLTRTRLAELLPSAPLACGASHEVSIDDEQYKVTVSVNNLGDYYYLNLHFVAPDEKALHVYMHSHVRDFSPFSLQTESRLFTRHGKDDVYLVNRLGMNHGHLEGGYSSYFSFERGKSRQHFYKPVTGLLNDSVLLNDIPKRTIAFQYEMLVCALQSFFSSSGQQKAILGLSGGIDSALVLVLAAAALGVENVLGVIMPSQYTAEASITSAQALAKNLGVATKVIPITSLTDAYLNTLAPYFKGLPTDTTEENLQARVRAVLLMALSNKFGHLLLNTSNKSECAVGYSTLYGDACGAVSVLGSLYKTEVYAMSRWLNREHEVIPSFIIERPPSAELRPDQTDQDSLPPYEILDIILTELIDKGKRPERIRLPHVPKETILRVARLVKNAAYKRYQMPPCLRIAPDTFFDK